MKMQKTLVIFYLQMRRLFMSLILLTILTGILYPLIITGIAQILFPSSANGNLLIQDQKRVGFKLIGQSFESPNYFWGRPSATTPYPYNANLSNSSNLGPNNPELFTSVKKRIEKIQLMGTEHQSTPIPIELLTSSGSGLDPHISPAGAFYQVPRIAKARQISEERLKNLIEQTTEKRQFGFLGEPRVNVLKLNLALDKITNLKVISNKIKKPDKNNQSNKSALRE